MKYLEEIREIVNEYSIINSQLNHLERMTDSLKLEKAKLDFRLEQTRERELSLIDKIVAETGEHPDYYKIMNELNETT